MEKVLYSQGIYTADIYDRANDNLISTFEKLTEGNLATTVDLSPITAGIGNPVQINIPTSATLTLSITAANLSQVGMSLNTGATITPNGRFHVKENITLDATGKGKVKSIPTYDLGSTTQAIVGWIHGISQPIEINPITREFTVVGLENKLVCIDYVTMASSADQFRIGSQFAPKIVRAVLRSPLYTTEAQEAKYGIVWGDMFIIIPKAQLNGDLTVSLSQTAPSTTLLNMTALPDYGVASEGECPSNDGTLGYIVFVPRQGDIFDDITKLVVMGGGISLEVNGTEKIIIKGLTTKNIYENIPYERLNFVSASPAIASVDNSTDLLLRGTVTGVSEGDTEIIITALSTEGTPLADISAVTCDVEVSA